MKAQTKINDIKEQYILIISNKSDITTDLVVRRMHNRNIPFIRFNTEEFPQNVLGEIKIDRGENNSAIITANKWELHTQHIKSIWYRRPKFPFLNNVPMNGKYLHFALRESNTFLANLWSVLNDKLWVNSPFDLYLAEKKAVQLMRAAECKMRIPNTVITNNFLTVKNFIDTHKEKVIVKPISHGAIGDDNEYAIFTTDLENKSYVMGEDSIKYSPFILQEKIDKEFDVRVNVFGRNIIAHKIKYKEEIKEIDWRVMKPNELLYEKIVLPKQLINNILNFMSGFKLKYSAMDFIVDKNGKWYFIENNPSGQFAWIEIVTGDKLIDMLIDLLCEGRE